MTLPNTSISKNVFTTGQAPASTVGILAILACSSNGDVDVPGGYARTDLAITDLGYGPLTEFFAYDVNVANQPCLLQKGTAGFAGAMGTITKTLASGSATVVNASSTPFDDYDFRATIVNGGVAGVDGITYTTTNDGGDTESGITAMGATVTMTVPNTGLIFTLGGTFTAGDTFQCFTTRPQLNNTNVSDSLAVLGKSRLPYEGILIDCSANTSTVGLIDTILSGWESKGIFKFAIINSQFKVEPAASAETEAAYAARIGTMFNNQTSIRQCVGADGARVPSAITGWNLKRPTSLMLAARAMQIPIGEDPAYVARGAIAAAQVSDSNGNPQDHDEDLYPNLDTLRFTTLRSFAPGGPQGVYICNAKTIQPDGGAFPYLQHIRIMNRACEIVWAVLTQQLSRGVRKNPTKDPLTGAVTIFEPDAAAIDALCNEALVQPMKGQVSQVQFVLSRTDDLNPVPAVVTGVLSLVALAYIKGFQVQAQFSKTLKTTL